MPQYSNSLKKNLCEKICLDGKSTIKTARDFGVPLKTLEKWITAYHKNKHQFDEEPICNDFCLISDTPININNNINYDDLSNHELKTILMKKEIEIARLKKNYQVINDGTENKVFVTFCKRNMK